jgi:hypothetical protein
MSQVAPTGRIPCILIAYNNPSVALESLSSVVAASDLLDIYVVELMSVSTESKSKPIMEQFVREGKVNKYILFDENISNNAVNLVFELLKNELANSTFVILSDLDIIIDPASVYEQIAIMLSNDNVFSCSVQIDTSRWREQYSETTGKLDRGIAEASAFPTQYIEHWTGMWMTMFRTNELLTALSVMDRNGYRLTDGMVNRFGKMILKKTWVMTRYAKGRDLNRERENADYSESTEDSRMRLGRSSPETGRYALFNHDLVSSCTVFDGAAHNRVDSKPMMRPAVKRHRDGWDDDPLYKLIVEGQISFERAFIVMSPPRLEGSPGLYVWLHPSATPPNSIPFYGEDKAVLHVNQDGLPSELRSLVHDVYLADALASEGVGGVQWRMKVTRHLLVPGGLVRGWIWSRKGDGRKVRLAPLKRAFAAARLPAPTLLDSATPGLPKYALSFQAGP